MKENTKGSVRLLLLLVVLITRLSRERSADAAVPTTVITTKPPTPTPISPTYTHVTSTHVHVNGATTPTPEVCANKIDSCDQYGHALCSNTLYESWSRQNCALYCGFCVSSVIGIVRLPAYNPDVNKNECLNKVPNCKDFDDGTLCTADSYHAWAYDNCRGYCKLGNCTDPCKDSDGIDCNILNATLSICNDVQKARLVCRRFCGDCTIVDGGWSTWSAWGDCSVTCDNGTQHRHRQCDNPPPTPNDGLDCTGVSQETQNCTKNPCPVHGNWGSWSAWGICSVSCGEGLRRRDRYCNNPYPDRLGDHCFGTPIGYGYCHVNDCIADSWSTWSEWSKCKNTCGSLTFRERSCLNRGPIGSATNCSGGYIETDQCNCTVSKTIRLQGGNNQNSGRVELYYNGTWGTVCDDGFTNSGAAVVCRMLGYSTSGAHFKNGVVTRFTIPPPGKIWLDDVSCTGHEATIDQCSHKPWGQHNCGQIENVYVYCYSGFKTYCGNSENTSSYCPKTPTSFTVTRPVAGHASNNIAFSSIVSMVGHGYNPTTGVYTCPVSGTYLFTVTLVKDVEYPKYFVHCFLRLNGADMVLIHINPQQDSSNGISATLYLTTGDRVDVGSCSRADLFDNTGSVFSGTLVN